MRCVTLTLAIILCASVANAAEPAFRPPAVPLVANDPYFSVWSFSDKLTDGPTRHWTGKEHPLSSGVRVDGDLYRLTAGDPSFAVLTQTSLQVLPTRTVYTFANDQVKVTLTFLTPALPDDLGVLSRPVTYVTWDLASVDGKPHDVTIGFAAAPVIAVNTPEQRVRWAVPKVPGLQVVSVGSEEQPVLEKKGDDLRIDWGHLYLAAPAEHVEVLSDASHGEALQANKAGAHEFLFRLGQVGRAQSVSRTMVLAYDDEYSLTYLGKKLRPYWRRDGVDAGGLLKRSLDEYPALKQRCEKFDDELMADLRKVGGEKYAQLCALAYRQCFAAHKIVADANGQPLIMSKENFSNGCIATVDVMYPAIPQFLLLSPTLAKASVVPILNYAATDRWKFPFAPHDLGTYPRADGQVYGGGERTEQNQMPVEESGNMLILVGAIAKMDGNADFAARWWPQLTRWANYLAEKGFDPENQLCTDDFAGHLAHNVNLSAKAIVALGCYADLCKMRGEQVQADKFRGLAEQFAKQWVTTAADGDHTRLAFDRPGTWSQKYNLVWDQLLDLNLFPREVIDKEIAFYLTKQNRYGLPLDNRKPWAKLDWTVWTATMTNKREEFEALTNPLYDFLHDTPDRAPMADWYQTASAKKEGFQARSVVGGVFIKMLSDPEAWKKWSSRDAQVNRNWAAAPKPLTIEPIVAIAPQQPATWRYTFDKPADGWERSDFDHAAWREGQSGFGDGKSPGSSVNTAWNTPDIWLRRTIDLPTDLGEQVHLLVHHDEDIEIYLNGVLAARRTGYLRDYEPVTIRPEARAALRAGKNLLAVHCRQTRGGQYVDVGVCRVTETP